MTAASCDLSPAMKAMIVCAVEAGGEIPATGSETMDALVRRDLASFTRQGTLKLTERAVTEHAAPVASDSLHLLVCKVAVLHRAWVPGSRAFALTNQHSYGAAVVKNVYGAAAVAS